MKMKKIVLAFLVVTCFSSVTVTANAGPTMHSFAVDHGDLSKIVTEADGQQRPCALKPWDTRNTALGIANAMVKNGYSGASYVNNQPSTVSNCMGQDAIFYYGGHAGAGAMAVVYNGGTSVALLAGKVNPYTVCVNNNMSKARLVYFEGCLTAVYSSVNGCLIDQAVTNGAKCSVGFNTLILKWQAAHFSWQMMVYYGTNASLTVESYTRAAAYDTAAAYSGDAGGTNYYRIAGDKTTNLRPAAYNN